MVEIMKSERNVGGGGGGGGAAGGGGPGGGGGVDPRSYESANSSHPLSSANPPNLPRPPIHPHPHSHTGPLLPPHTHAPAAVMTQQVPNQVSKNKPYQKATSSMAQGPHGPHGGQQQAAAAALNHHNHMGMVTHNHSPMQRQFHPHSHAPPVPTASNGVALASSAAPGPAAVHREAVHRESNSGLFNHNNHASHNGAAGGINGVTVVNGGPPNLQSGPLADSGETDNEKWWWVCCLEFCFCLL